MEKKTFIQWIRTYNRPEAKDHIFAELHSHTALTDEFRSQVYLLKKYIGWIRNTYDSQTISTVFKENIDSNTKWGIHKILFHAPDNAKCWDYIEAIMKDKAIQIIDKI